MVSLHKTSSFLWAGIINHINLLILETTTSNMALYSIARDDYSNLYLTTGKALKITISSDFTKNLQTYVCW